MEPKSIVKVLSGTLPFMSAGTMRVEQRALLIAMLGPAIQVVGLVWEAVHLLTAHLHDPLDPRHLVLEAPVLIVLAGLMVSIVCIPVALEVAASAPEDVEVHVFEDDFDLAKESGR
jgi:hypothetical protein